MSKARRQWDDYCTKYKSYYVGHSNEEIARQQTLKAALSLAILVTSNHTTRLQDGTVLIKFVEGFEVTVRKEITAEGLLSELANLIIDMDSNKEYVVCKFIFMGSSTLCSDPKVKTVFRGFLQDPMASVPSGLKDKVLQALKKKVKSINKRLRNYDSEKARRDRGRKSRAITSLAKVLAKLDPSFRELAVQALRNNVTTRGKYNYEEHSLLKFLDAINTMCSGNNLKNWKDKDVIPEAERLASIQWVMDQ